MLFKTIIPAAYFAAALSLVPNVAKKGVQSLSFPSGDTVVVVADTSIKETVEENQLDSFMKDVAKLESDGKVNATNRYGMLGKYQFDMGTLRQMGIVTSRTKFLSNETLQDSAMIQYMKENREELLPYIKKYAGTQYRGIWITESAILAGAHFAGSVGVKRFFTKNKNRRDGNGTTLAFYMSKFTGYNLEKLLGF